MNFEYRSKPRKCPHCKSDRVATIQYGMPVYSDKLQRDIDAGRIILGGCCIGEHDPQWKCTDCGTEIIRMERS